MQIQLTKNVTSKKHFDCLIKIFNKDGYHLDGQNYTINGRGLTLHLMHIHNSNDVVIKNVRFTGGNTSYIKKIPRSQIIFYHSKKSIFELIDGGAVLITGNSSVKFENCKFIENKSLMCGGAISNQSSGVITFINCDFVNNEAGHTGSAIDNLVNYSKVKIIDCHFSNNKSNSWLKFDGPHGQVSIFPNSSANIINCVFSKGSIPFDYYINSNLVLKNNKYLGFSRWSDDKLTSRNFSIIEWLKIFQRLYWLFPKTIGKVFFKVKNSLDKEL